MEWSFNLTRHELTSLRRHVTSAHHDIEKTMRKKKKDKKKKGVTAH